MPTKTLAERLKNVGADEGLDRREKLERRYVQLIRQAAGPGVSDAELVELRDVGQELGRDMEPEKIERQLNAIRLHPGYLTRRDELLIEVKRVAEERQAAEVKLEACLNARPQRLDEAARLRAKIAKTLEVDAELEAVEYQLKRHRLRHPHLFKD